MSAPTREQLDAVLKEFSFENAIPNGPWYTLVRDDMVKALIESRAELQRLRTLADDDAAVERAMRELGSLCALSQKGYEAYTLTPQDWRFDGVQFDDIRSALRAALGGAP